MLNAEIPKHHSHLVFLNNVIYEQRASTYALISGHESAMTDFFSFNTVMSFLGLD